MIKICLDTKSTQLGLGKPHTSKHASKELCSRNYYVTDVI